MTTRESTKANKTQIARAKNAVRNQNIDFKDKNAVRKAIYDGVLRPGGAVRNYGLKPHEDLCNYVGIPFVIILNRHFVPLQQLRYVEQRGIPFIVITGFPCPICGITFGKNANLCISNAGKNAASEGTVDALVRARVAAEEAQKALAVADRQWAAAAKQLSGADWRKLVDAVKERVVRIQAACIVWWDHFGPRPASDPWTDLDEYKAAWRADQNADKHKVQKALVAIGYPEHKAAARMKSADEDSANVTAAGGREQR